MAEYINREAALKVLAAGRGCGNICSRAIKNIPAANVVSVVHCRDCKHARKSKEVFEFDAVTPLCECSYMKLPHRWYEYCSWGERRESE